MAFSNTSILSPRSVFRFHPLIFSRPLRPIQTPRWNPIRSSRRFFAVMAMEKSEVFTSPETAKSFDFTSEERIYNWWESQGYFKPNFDRGGDPFVIPMPPPNVTGSLHMGHAMFVTLEDIMARYFRMKGRPTLWIPGTDHAGIATQLVVERMLASEGIKRTDLTREEFTSRVWQWKEKYGGTITNQIKRLGASCDWMRERFTLDEQLSRAVVEAFLRLCDKGLIYRGSYIVNWSPNLQTAVSDLEVEYSEEPGFLYHIKYRVAGGSRTDYLTIATTRPETLFGDTAIAVNPEYVDKDFGTGVLKISPGHDRNDYLLARKLGLPILNVMNKDGTLNEVAGLYSGLDRFKAREKLWSDLEEANLAVKKEPYTLRVPRSQRGGEIIEPLVSKQWFVTMEPLAKKGLDAVDSGQLTIIPERFEKGRKMSKSLGNVVDPIDTIKDYGTDALRFTLALGTPGQDLNLSVERLTSNKAFTNKLWNAGKFVLQNLPNASDQSAWESLLSYKFDTEESLRELPLPECWVVSELHELIDTVTSSYEKFFFGDVGREIYDFFWADFADWYIEASKTRVYHSEDYSICSLSRAVLLYVFGTILKLIHPFMPFVTEELWQALPHRNEALIVSPWPKTSLPRDLKSTKNFENLQAVTRAIRNARAEYSVEPSKRISASVVANADVLQYMSIMQANQCILWLEKL
ncbi:Valine--tRNA ligase [Acorus calamus]|uniref:valine--tRNA ligase n=1 Tax=Acorus calamus TaxID=4465 RepID=A0AAV9EE97_ACOCL|nr:Valine--tRNA ligase [Acorus calamus]